VLHIYRGGGGTKPEGPRESNQTMKMAGRWVLVALLAPSPPAAGLHLVEKMVRLLQAVPVAAAAAPFCLGHVAKPCAELLFASGSSIYSDCLFRWWRLRLGLALISVIVRS
jgi:hypothetical protein